MFVIAGLGNPGGKYEKTRHNVGFQVLDRLAGKYNIEINKKRHHAFCGTGIMEGTKVLFVKPQTFMNLSGESIQEMIQFYKIEMENLMVIYDDIDIEPGIIKIRKAGGAGTHNGMKSVLQALNTQNFKRIRVGIGKPKNKEDLVEYVLGAIPEEEKSKLDKGTELAKEAVIEMIKNGIDIAMNQFN